MSWPTWSAAAAPIPAAVAAPVQTTLLPTGINSAPAVIPPTLHQYSQEQWAQAQQQNWQQWAQWQQQYQQWHQQYGAEYQKSLTAMQAGALPTVTQPTLTAVQPPLPAVMATPLAPPLPVDNKPPLPPEEPPTSVVSSYSTAPPKLGQTGFPTTPLMATQILPPQVGQVQSQPNQTDQYGNNQSWTSTSQKRPYGQETEYSDPKRVMTERSVNQWGQPRPASQWQSSNQSYNQPPPQTQVLPPAKANVEELSEAEKKFDKEFAAWEAQFNKWKEQNANHPDKTQYREYEKKWESWRNSLLERREQMRRKRLALTGQTAAVVTKPQTFNQPPPIHQSSPSQPPPLMSQRPPVIQDQTVTKPSLLGASPGMYTPSSVVAPKATDQFFSKPPPNQNNEPLAFKSAGFPQPVEIEDTGNDFLKPSSSSGGIPGLDLVPDEGKPDEVPEKENSELSKTEPVLEEQAPPSAAAQGPDFDAISKGINTILGDQKLSSMLSMVPQNPSVNTGRNVAVDSISTMRPSYIHGRPNFSGPPPTQMPHQGGNFNIPPPSSNLPFNEQSNHSFEDKVHRDDYSQQREVVNNFDDQTRSSFTMGPSDNDQGFRNRGPGTRFGVPPPESRNNFSLGGQRNISENFGRGLGRDSFLEGPGNFDRGNNFNRNDRFKDNIRNDDGFQGDRFDSYRDDRFGGNNESRGNFGGSGAKFGRQDNSNFNRSDSGFGRENPIGRSSFNKYNDYDNHDEDDFETYHQKFADDEDQYHDNEYQRPNIHRPPPSEQLPPQKQPKIPSLMDQIAPAPPQIQAQIQAQLEAQAAPPPVEEELFEPENVVDYEHKSQQQDDPDISVEPLNMFDYRHKPFNRIPLPERPKWLAESVKFIREFDPIASRYDRISAPGPVDRFSVPREEDRFSRGRSFEEREMTFPVARGGPFEREEFHREREEFHRERDEFPRERDDFHRDRTDFRHDREDFQREREFPRNRDSYRRDNKMDRSRETGRQRFEEDRYSRGRSENESNNRKNERNSGSRMNKDDFDDLSDEDMDWEQGEQKRHLDQQAVRNSRSKSPELSNPPNPSNNSAEIAMIEDIIDPPGRLNRPPRIVIIIRGPPGSGKTFLVKQIKDKEVENGGSAPRILSLDDYFMVEHEKQILEDGKTQTIKEMVYEYEAEMEESYRSSLLKSFKKTITDGYFSFVIVDNVNDKVKHFGEMWSFAKQNGFQVYICQLDLDPVVCIKRNIHNRTEAEIEECIAGWEPTPSHHPTIDASNLLQASSAITEVEMELEDNQPTERQENEQKDQPPQQNFPEEEKKVGEVRDQVRSKWDTFDCSSNNLAKLDGVSKPLRKSHTMEEYLQLESEWEPPKPSKSGKKRVGHAQSI
nr:YLP motif-containing protein 1-like isoform X1 [Leptinotarsa decemlineata]XP_023029816.1 YLP motif-containing protein 1-like isoform X1 [Leptinotarsa decemlineata]XP_023029817.1 YLP motif-containing protein 1-like isoform X1 [Leptinotarsa decemlineata]